MTAPRSFLDRPVTRSIAAIALISTSLVLGCSSRNPVRPVPRGGADLAAGSPSAGAAGFGSGAFYPLSVGNAWNYAGGGIVSYLGNDGPVPYFTWAFTESDRLVGTVVQNEATYFVREEVTRQVPDDGYGPFTYWTRMRQDAAGLYFADSLLFDSAEGTGTSLAAVTRGPRLDFTRPGSSARTAIALARLADRVAYLRGVVRGLASRSSTPGAIELLELSYPLRIGATWDIRPDVPWPATVEKVEILDTPAGSMNAYRIGINPGGTMIHEGEWARVWYSRDGYLGYSIHTFIIGTDENGDPTGETYVADDSLRVASLAISR